MASKVSVTSKTHLGPLSLTTYKSGLLLKGKQNKLYCYVAICTLQVRKWKQVAKVCFLGY